MCSISVSTCLLSVTNNILLRVFCECRLTFSKVLFFIFIFGVLTYDQNKSLTSLTTATHLHLL